MMHLQERVTVSRDIDAYLVPSAIKIKILKDSEVIITQALGGSYTVYIDGNLARVDGKDGDALGKEILDPFSGLDVEHTSLEELVWSQLKTCYDPEIPVNIVDLGLVYDCQIIPLGRDEQAIHVKMTLTAPGCGMGPVLTEDVKQKLLSIPHVKQAEVEIVFDPPWDRSKMSEAAKLQLGLL